MKIIATILALILCLASASEARMTPKERLVSGLVMVAGGVVLMTQGGRRVVDRPAQYDQREVINIDVNHDGTFRVYSTWETYLVRGESYRRNSDAMIFAGFLMFTAGGWLTFNADGSTVRVSKDIRF